ncbi:DoxX family protein [Halobacteria archaeon AArc-m2/3/4]|uniref:DoxX family protein n=1 Tax=Natronoglomus mannanivorans TaxID=2979990 RepID=A0AAP3E4P7_9EURY|nr:DoxX family protein [Halobacteria archaeon AArc-xg1-1]MCU4975866.1 DoxX family protein [Halobacteria archaeon AArc-m2/3/4]
MATQRKPAERTIDADLFGTSVQFDYSETWLAYSMLGLRLLLAWVFLQAGLSKLSEGGWTNPGGWSAEGFLLGGVAEANPFSSLFDFFADFLWLIEPMVLWGQIFIGLALLFGVAFRFAAAMGALQMLLFWLGAFEGGLMAGFPIAHGYVVDYTLVYAILLFGLGAWGAGRLLGVDAILEQSDIVQQNPWLRYFLG